MDHLISSLGTADPPPDLEVPPGCLALPMHQFKHSTNGPCGCAVYFRRHEDKTITKHSLRIELSGIDVAPDLWKPIPLAAQLGVHMVYVTEQEYKLIMPTPPAFLNDTTSDAQNAMLDLFTMDMDPESATYGQGPSHGKVTGMVLFKFLDGGLHDQMRLAYLNCLEMYLSRSLRAIAIRRADDGVEAAKVGYANLTAKVLKEFYKRVRAGESDDENFAAALAPLACPVVLEVESCEACSVERKEGSKALQKCGKCKKVVYCSRECQKADWKAHKPCCRIEEVKETIGWRAVAGRDEQGRVVGAIPAPRNLIG